MRTKTQTQPNKKATTIKSGAGKSGSANTAKTVTIPAVPQKIFDVTDTSNTGITFWQQRTFQEITEKSGVLANANEYQIHYWALVLRLNFKDESIIDIAYPTAIFNYKQKVTNAHVDFELSDVNEISPIAKPIHDILTASLIEQLTPAITDIIAKKDMEISYEFISVPMNTLHRHPMGVSSFSGTDLRKNHISETGIVFPLAEANKTPSYSSIIYNHPPTLVLTEYRLATGSTESETGIEYRKGLSVAVVKEVIPASSQSSIFFGIGNEKQQEHLKVVGKDISIDAIKSIIELFNVEYVPNTDLVFEQNVTKQAAVFSYKQYGGYSNYSRTTTSNTTAVAVTATTDMMRKEFNSIQNISNDSFKLKYEAELKQMSNDDLIIYSMELDLFYYGIPSPPSDYEGLTRNSTLTSIYETEEQILEDNNIHGIYKESSDLDDEAIQELYKQYMLGNS